MSCHNFPAQKKGILQSGRGKNLVQDENAIGRGVGENIVNAHQVILQFAAQVVDVLLPLKMGKNLVEQKKPRLPARHRATEPDPQTIGRSRPQVRLPEAALPATSMAEVVAT